MSALPQKADIAQRDPHVRFVPKADIGCLIRLPTSNVAMGRHFARRVLFQRAGIVGPVVGGTVGPVEVVGNFILLVVVVPALPVSGLGLARADGAAVGSALLLPEDCLELDELPVVLDLTPAVEGGPPLMFLIVMRRPVVLE